MSMQEIGSPTAIPRKADFSTVIPRFFTQEIATDQVDGQTGLKVYRTVEFVELLIPGDKGSAPVKRVNDQIRAMYRDQYARWKEQGGGADMVGDGIPLKLWPGIKQEVARGLENINIWTVQQLAAMSDSRCTQPGTMGLRDLRDKARAFLESASQTAPIAALQAQLDDMKKRETLRDDQLKQALQRAEEAEAKLGGVNVKHETMPELNTPRGRQKQERE